MQAENRPASPPGAARAVSKPNPLAAGSSPVGSVLRSRSSILAPASGRRDPRRVAGSPSNQPSSRFDKDTAAIGSVARITYCLVLLLGLGWLAACGSSTNPSSSTTPHPAETATATATTGVASPPPGRPAPTQLIGAWIRVTHTADEAAVVTIDANVFSVSDKLGGASGEIVVNGHEIDFFNVPQCHLFLPKGVGRYRWQLHGATLHFTPLNSDPCPVRHAHFANQNFTKNRG